MSWLKYTPVFKHGHGSPGYVFISDDTAANKDLLDDLKSDIRDEHGDPDGFREPIWEIVEVPPTEYLEALIKEDEDRVRNALVRIRRNRKLLGKT